MTENSNANQATDRKAMATISTKTHGVDAIPVETLGTLDGITVLGEPLTVRFSGKKVEIVTVGKQEQIYVANKPRPTDSTTGPVVKVNGKLRKHTSHKAGAFPAGPNGPNRMARQITTVKLQDATVTMTDGQVVTIDGSWWLIACVKHDEAGRNYRHEMIRKATPNGEVPVVRYING